jgi:hypothetical protein
MKAIKTSHNEDISGMKISVLGKIIDQVSEDDVSDVKRHVIPIFKGWRK